MNVQVDLLKHPKFLLLKRELGDHHGPSALEFLLRLWGHCQDNKRGANWGNVSSDYVEMVCEWPGGAGVLYKALLKPMMVGRSGFAELRGRQFIVHDWDHHNARLIANWNRNPDGRRGKADVKPDGTQPEAVASRKRSVRGTNKRGEEGRGLEGIREEGSGVVAPPDDFSDPVEHPPGLQTVIAYGKKMAPECPEENSRRFWNHHQGQGWKMKDWRPHLVNWWAEDLKKTRASGPVAQKKAGDDADWFEMSAPQLEDLALGLSQSGDKKRAQRVLEIAATKKRKAA